MPGECGGARTSLSDRRIRSALAGIGPGGPSGDQPSCSTSSLAFISFFRCEIAAWQMHCLRISTWILHATNNTETRFIMPVTVRGDDCSNLTQATGSAVAIYPSRPARLREFAFHAEAGSLPHHLIGRLPAHEWRRRLIHMSPGLLPALLWVIPHPDPLAWYSQVIISVVILGMSIFALRNARLFERPHETGWAVSVISYAVITLGLLLGFPSRPEMGLAVTVIIAFGDGAATLGGLLVKGPRLPWNNHKSWAGLCAFLLVSIPAAAIVYWGEARPGVSLLVALACAGPAALAASLAETLPVRLNDNVRVGVTAAVVIVVMQAALVG